MKHFPTKFFFVIFILLTFLGCDDEYISISYPDAFTTAARGMNDDGIVVGYYRYINPDTETSVSSPFVYYVNQEAFSTPEALINNKVSIYDINNGNKVVGRFPNSNEPQIIKSYSGFIYDMESDTFERYSYPGASSTGFNGINNFDQAVGQCTIDNNRYCLIKNSDDSYTMVDPPETVYDSFVSINDHGIALGYGFNSSLKQYYLYNINDDSLKLIDVNVSPSGWSYITGIGEADITISLESINNDGEIIGSYSYPSAITPLYNVITGILVNSEGDVLKKYKYRNIELTDLNNAGEAVGFNVGYDEGIKKSYVRRF